MMTEQEFQSMTLAQHNELPELKSKQRFERMSKDQRKRLLSQAQTPGKPTGQLWAAVVAKFTASQKG